MHELYEWHSRNGSMGRFYELFPSLRPEEPRFTPAQMQARNDELRRQAWAHETELQRQAKAHEDELRRQMAAYTEQQEREQGYSRSLERRR